MKPGPVTKLENKNKTMYGQFGAIRKLDIGHIVCKTYTFHLIKCENRTRKSLTQLLHYCFKKKYYFCKKNAVFLQNNGEISKIRKVWILKSIFFETTHECVLTYQNGPLKIPPRLGLIAFISFQTVFYWRITLL